MKRCSYCGAEYPDDAIECAIDQTPFGGISRKPATHIQIPRFGIISEHKIPVSLSLVSYLFFFTGAGLFAAIGMVAFLAVFATGLFGTDHFVIPCLIGGAFTVLLVTCMLMFPITMLFAYFLFIICLFGFHIDATADSGAILSRLMGGAIAVLFVYISRGLRNGSRGWRTCALVFIWLQFAVVVFGVVRYFLNDGYRQHEWAAMDWLECLFGVIVLVFQYRVLIRPDVRGLFYDESPPNDVL